MSGYSHDSALPARSPIVVTKCETPVRKCTQSTARSESAIPKGKTLFLDHSAFNTSVCSLKVLEDKGRKVNLNKSHLNRSIRHDLSNTKSVKGVDDLSSVFHRKAVLCPGRKSSFLCRNESVHVFNHASTSFNNVLSKELLRKESSCCGTHVSKRIMRPSFPPGDAEEKFLHYTLAKQRIAHYW